MGAGLLSFNLRIEGAKEVQRALHDLPTFILSEVRQELPNAGKIIVAIAKDLVPVDTGALRRSIRGHFDPNNRWKYLVYAVGGAGGREYAAPVEYGRKKLNRSDAQPFLRPAIARGAPLVKQHMIAAIQKAVYNAGFHPSRFGLGTQMYHRGELA